MGWTLALTVAACFTASSRDVTQPTGVIGIKGGGGGGGGGSTYNGSYRLQTVNDSAVPFKLADDSASGTGGSGDTTRVFIASIDSSLLYLNTDTSAKEIDYLTIRDARTATDSSFDRIISFADTTFGYYSSSGTTVVVSLTDTVGGDHTVSTTYTVSGSTLSGTVSFVLYNTDGAVAAAGDAAYVYGYTGAPLQQLTRPGDRSASESRVGSIRDAAALSNVRAWRPPVWAGASRSLRLGPARTRP